MYNNNLNDLVHTSPVRSMNTVTVKQVDAQDALVCRANATSIPGCTDEDGNVLLTLSLGSSLIGTGK